MNITAVLLSGGQGRRMGAEIPKQYLTINNKSIAEYGFEVLLSHKGIVNYIVVCEESWEEKFCHLASLKVIQCVRPGVRRQDSLRNALVALKDISEAQNHYILVHDAARPCISEELLSPLIEAAQEYGAAVLGVPVNFTVKIAEDDACVKQTLDRNKVWEIQTPQIVRLDVLRKGFEKIQKENISISDDVSIAELMGCPVKLVMGSRANIKVTTSEDLLIVKQNLTLQMQALRS